MGFLRLLLAITVIVAHSNPFFGFIFIGGQFAVEVFFVISGFYMALILSEKYNQKDNRKYFLSNRFLKIFPIYWIILILSLIYEIANLKFHFNPLNVSLLFNSDIVPSFWSYVFLILTNIIIFGQDLTLFMTMNPKGSLIFTPNFREHQPLIYNFMLIPQAWTLALELMFYLFAPFLNKLKSKWLILIMGLSLFVRFTLAHFGYSDDPWSYRFFPSEIFFFISGIISYRIYNFIRNINIPNKIFIPIYSFYLAFIIFFQFIPHNRTKILFLFTLSILLLPFLFKFLKKNKFDRFLGELSYPVYICHFLVINTLTHFFNVNHQYLGFIATFFSIILSILIQIFIVNPIDKYRQRRLKLQSTI